MSGRKSSTRPEWDSDVPDAIGHEPGPRKWTTAFFRSQMRGAWRQIWFRWPGRQHAMKAARVEKQIPTKNGKGTKNAVFYVCAECGQLGKPMANKGGYPRMWVDHKEPLVPTDGLPIDWDTYLHRLFCGPEDLQVLCEPCHKTKSKEENHVRRTNKKELVRRHSEETEGDTTSDTK